MILREDYYTPYVEEINRKEGLDDDIIYEITLSNYDKEFGMENLKHSDNIEGTDIRKIIKSSDGGFSNSEKGVAGYFSNIIGTAVTASI